MPVSLEQSVEELIDFVCEVLGRNLDEGVRRRAQSLLVQDHGRRLAVKGLHPITGETREGYAETAQKYGGKHPVTAQSADETDWGG